MVQRLVSRSQIERFVYEPPEDTRAWTRAMLLRVAGADRVNNMDWDRITVRLAGSHGLAAYQVIWMQDPRRWTRRDTEHLIRQDLSLEQLVAELRALPGAAEKTAAGEPATVVQGESK